MTETKCRHNGRGSRKDRIANSSLKLNDECKISITIHGRRCHCQDKYDVESYVSWHVRLVYYNRKVLGKLIKTRGSWERQRSSHGKDLDIVKAANSAVDNLIANLEDKRETAKKMEKRKSKKEAKKEEIKEEVAKAITEKEDDLVEFSDL